MVAFHQLDDRLYDRQQTVNHRKKWSHTRVIDFLKQSVTSNRQKTSNDQNFTVSETAPSPPLVMGYDLENNKGFLYRHENTTSRPSDSRLVQMEVSTLVIKWLIFFCNQVSDFFLLPEANSSSAIHLFFVSANFLWDPATSEKDNRNWLNYYRKKEKKYNFKKIFTDRTLNWIFLRRNRRIE